MSLLEILQLIGYSFGAALHLWMGALLIRQRTTLNAIERVLLALAICIGLWHAGNLIISLHTLLGLSAVRWTTALRSAETLAVICVTLCYSLLLHVHLHLWANARERPLTVTERARVYLSYLPLIFLVFAIPAVWRAEATSMLEKLARVNIFGAEWNFVAAFSFWATYVLALVSVTDLLIARIASERRERIFMRTLAASFFLIAALLLGAHAFDVGAGTPLGAYLQTLANLGSLLPTALLAYYIYRYHYLELIIKNSLVVALFAVVVLVIYLYGIRALGESLTARYGLRAGFVETLLILALALVAAPLRGWLEQRFNTLFSRETSLYRDVLARIGMLARESRRYEQLPEALGFVAERTSQTFGFRRVRFLLRPNAGDDETDADEAQVSIVIPPDEDGAWTSELLGQADDARTFEDTALLRERGWHLGLPLRREDETLGMMLVDAPHERLTSEVRQALTVLAAQVALAIAECRLVEENVRLERRLAHGERLAALGQMAATVAHEIKNPLSAIKSIAQVMREDASLAAGYSRDLDLIVGETDRLSRSVTQLLSWTRHSSAADAPARAADLLAAVLHLCRYEAQQRGVEVELIASAGATLSGAQAAAMRDAVSNLLLNAMQATPPGKRVEVETEIAGGTLVTRITDGGTGVPAELRARIWEPFFTTKQRGTGLGLAIVRKRIGEVGGIAQLLDTPHGAGACFELRLPLRLN